jgi:hypothetical protein
MFKFASDTAMPGFRVGLLDQVPGFSIDENGSVRRPLLAAPGAMALGYDPYNELIPTQYHPYLPVSGDTSIQDPLRQAVDRAMTKSTEGRPPKIHCDKRWTGQPTFPPVRPSLLPRH